MSTLMPIVQSLKSAGRHYGNQPRIGIYDNSDGPSGLSRYIDTILSGIDPDEFEVILFCHSKGPYHSRSGVRLVYTTPDRPVADHLELTNNKSVPQSRPSFPKKLWHLAAPDFIKLWCGFGRDSIRLAKVFASCPVDLLYTHIISSEPAAVAARLAGIPLVLGGFHIDSSRSDAWHWPLEYITDHSLHRAIAVSESTKRDWSRRTCLSAQRIQTILNGVNVQRYEDSPSQVEARRRLGLPLAPATIIGCVGRLTEQKGFSYLLDAVASLAPRYSAVQVIFVGDGPMRPCLSQQAHQMGIADRVQFVGFRSDVESVLPAFDLFALPSLWEALPYALLEAMASALPIVATSVAGVPEVVVPGETGYLVPPYDSNALAAALRPLLDSSELRVRMGHAGRERVVKYFREDDMVRKTIQVYREMLSSSRRFPFCNSRVAAC